MKRQKSDETLDRLSELDDSMIFVILSFLPMRDVVRTTILSKRWIDLWFTLPTLNFVEHNKTSVDSRNFINRALMLWKGTKIQKLEFSFGHPFDESLFPDMDLWLCFAKERNVEELYIKIPESIPHYIVYQPPQCLYSCSSLTKLSLLEINLEIHGNVHWHHLKSLELHVHNFSEDMISQVVSSSPQLENLVLHICRRHGWNLTFRSSSLRVLSVYTIEYEPSLLTLSTPKLEALSISGAPCCERFLIVAQSVTDLTLDITNLYIDELRATLRQIDVAFLRLESVTLSVFGYKILAAMKGKCLIPPLMNAKLLRLRCDPNPIKPDEIVRLLEIFPKVERLLIHWSHDYDTMFLERQMPRLDSEDFFNSDGESSCSESTLAGLLEQLKIVEITWSFFYDVFVFQFVELLLKHAAVIEKIVIRRSGDEEIESRDVFLAAQKLLSLQRSFPDVEIVFCRIC